MNCTSTHSTGSRSGSDKSLRRKSVYHNKFCQEPQFEETDQVWTEAGFLPPTGCRRTVALLHRLAMNEEPVASLLSLVLTATAVGVDNMGNDYRIFDQTQLRRTAGEYGIDPAGRSDEEIARAVALAIISEYGESAPEEDA